MQQDIERWNRKFAGRAIGDKPVPDDFLVGNLWLPRGGGALDLASGSGQNAVYLATLGFRVTAIDGSSEGMKLALQLARNAGVEITPQVADLDEYTPTGQYELVVVMHYLNRALFASLPDLLKPDGILVAKTFNGGFLEQRPSFNPDYVLKDGEYLRLFRGLDVLLHQESPDSAPGKSLFVGRRPN